MPAAPAFPRFARLAAMTVVALASPAMAQLFSNGSTAPDWGWLKNTVWVVPPAYLPSFLYNAKTNVLLPAPDQTVYTITDYRNGYFWGKTVAKAGNLPVNCASLIGSVTPQGKLLLAFMKVDNGNATQQQGFGEMVKKDGAWTMLNQTSTTGYVHWAYMVQSKPTDATWRSLPGVGMSVPDFLAQCPGSGPQLGVR